MATPIKETPVLYGRDAERFLRNVADNARRDHRAEYERAKATFERLDWRENQSRDARPHR